MDSHMAERPYADIPSSKSGIWQAIGNRSRRWLALGSMLGTLLLAQAALPAPVSPAGPESVQKEAILSQVQSLLADEQTNPAKLREAISRLEGPHAQFPGEIRVPLYLAEAYYRLADPDADVNREFPYYEKTGFYSQQALQMDPGRPEAHYWHGLFLLKSAEKRGGVGAFSLVRKGIKELEQVRQSLPAYDHAGASRVLALLHCRAPRWTPFGNLDRAITLGKEASRLAPDYLPNRLVLAGAYAQRGDKNAAIQEYQALITACAKLAGDQAQKLCQQARTELASLTHH